MDSPNVVRFVDPLWLQGPGMFMRVVAISDTMIRVDSYERKLSREKVPRQRKNKRKGRGATRKKKNSDHVPATGPHAGLIKALQAQKSMNKWLRGHLHVILSNPDLLSRVAESREIQKALKHVPQARAHLPLKSLKDPSDTRTNAHKMQARVNLHCSIVSSPSHSLRSPRTSRLLGASRGKRSA